jgi:hypothetical protein
MAKEQKKNAKPKPAGELKSSTVDSKAAPAALETGEKVENWASKPDSAPRTRRPPSSTRRS